MPLSKQALLVENNTNFPNNNTGYITPALLREFNADMIDAMQLTQSMSEYAVLSGSNSFIGNQTITGDLNVSGVISASVLHVQYETASVIFSTGSNQLGDELTDIQTLSGSVKIQGQLLINGIPLSSGSATIDTGSLVTTASFNAYTQSANQRLTSLETNSASVNISISNLNTTTASLNTSITNINQFTQSQAALNGTFATTGSNTFTGNQVIDRASKLYTNGVYWTDMTAGFNNLEIINQGGGNLDFASLNGGRMRVVNTPLQLTGSALSSNSDISTSANVYGANLTASAIPAGTISSSAQITALGFVSSSVTASSLITASFSGNTLTFTKGDASTFGVVIPDVSGSTINTGSLVTTASFNAYTASNDQRVSSLEVNSASVNISITNINTTTASLNSSVSQLNTFTASQLTINSGYNSYTQSNDTKWNTLGGQSGSWITESETASFARTNVDNNFTANQTFTNITAVSASFTYVQTTYETSSVIYSSGSNQFGDELSDIQTLSGSVKVQGSLTVNGTPVLTSSVDISGLTTTASFNSYTSSNDQKVDSLISATGSYATTGSNNFVGNQTITGSLYVSSSTQKDVIIEGQLWVSSSNMFASGSTVQPQINISGPLGGTAGGSRSGSMQLIPDKITILRGTRTVNISSTVINVADSAVGSAGQSSAIYPGGLDNGTLDGNEIGLTINGDYLGVTNFSGPSIWIADNTLAYKAMFGFQDTTNYTDGRITAFTPLSASAGFTASLQNGYAWVGNSLGQNTQVATSSFAGTAINTGSFATTGSNSFNGSQTITGSITTTQDITISGVKFGFGNPAGTSSIAIGNTNTLENNTDDNNIAIGNAALQYNTTGERNIGIGTEALKNITGNSSYNTVIGGYALSQATASTNTFALGYGAMELAETSTDNIAIGVAALYRKKANSNTNTAIGSNALREHYDGDTNSGKNMAFGYDAMRNVTSGSANTAIGEAALRDAPRANENVFIGWTSGINAGHIEYNTVIGARAAIGIKNNYNTIIGHQAANQITSGSSNTIIGQNAAVNISSGSSNTIIGQAAGAEVRGGSGNTFIGHTSGYNTSGSNNTFIGPYQGKGDESGVIVLSDGGQNLRAIYNSGWIFTGSVDIQNTLTASLQEGYVWVGNSAGRTVTVATSSFGGGGTINTGSFATTGSNSFNGDQTITGSVRAGTFIVGTIPQAPTIQSLDSGTPEGNTSLQVNAGASGSFSLRTLYGAGVGKAILEAYDTFPSYTAGGKIEARSAGGVYLTGYAGPINMTGSALQMQGFTYPTTDGTSGQVLTTDGSKTLSFTTPAGTINTGSFATTGSNQFIGDQTINGNVIVQSGSVVSITGQETGGRVIMLGHSGSLVLGNSSVTTTYASLSHLSSSAPTANTNIIFKTTNTAGDTIISGSSNLFVNPATVTTGFKRYIGGNGNIALNGSNVPQISGSMAFSPQLTNNFFAANATTLNMRGPVSSSAWLIQGNIVQGTVNVGSSATLNAEKLTAGLTLSNNNIAGTLNIIANQSALTGSTTTLAGNVIAGTVTFNLSSSAATFNNNIINDSGFTFTNQFFTGSAGLGLAVASRNNINGQANSFIYVGTHPAGTATIPQIGDNFIGGGQNIIYSDITNASVISGNAYHSATRNILFGNTLIITGSSLTTDFNSFGSAFFGRYNAQDGNRAKTSQTVFAVGTGTSTTRKTGFLIDSGSNTYVEGTLNVSGSTTLSGSLYIQSGSTLPVSTGSAILTWDAATGQVKQASYSTIISASVSSGEFWSTTTQSGSAGVSGSVIFNNSGSFYNTSVVNGTRLQVANGGVYNIQFSAQIETSAGADTLWIWFKKNGNNIDASASKVVLANNTAQIMTVNILDEAVANDYYEIAYQNLNGHATILAEAASGNIPAIPSVIATIFQIR